MANKKVKFLSKQDKAFLLDVERYNPGFTVNVEKTGNMPNWFIDAVQRGKAQYGSDTDRKIITKENLGKLDSLVKSLGTPKIFERFIKDTADEVGLTSNELKDRLESFQSLGEFSTPAVNDVKGFSKKVHDFIIRRVKEVGYGGSADLLSPGTIGERIANRIISGQNDTAQEIAEEIMNEMDRGAPGFGRDAFNEIKKIGVEIERDFNKGTENYTQYFKPVVPAQDVSVDVKRLQDAIATATTKEEKDAAIESYLSGLPEELKSSRESFLSGEEDRAFSALERQVPLVLQNLNVRGMLQSGEREDELTTRALSLGSSLEEIQAELEADDNQFYFDAAFQNALRNELSRVEDYRSAISGARNKILTERERGFRSSQSELDRQLQEDLTTSSYARDISLQRKKLQKERQQQQDANRLGIVSKIAETGANVATNVAIDRVG